MATLDPQQERRDEDAQRTRRSEHQRLALAGDGHEPQIDVRLKRPGSGSPFAAVVSLCGEHDLATNAELGATLGSFFGNVLVDLTECSFIECTTIGVLVDTHRTLARDGHRIELIAPSEHPQVAALLELVGLSQVIRFRPHAPPFEESCCPMIALSALPGAE